MDVKLNRIRELINDKERIDAELNQLIGGGEVPRRGRPRKDRDAADSEQMPMENGHATETF